MSQIHYKHAEKMCCSKVESFEGGVLPLHILLKIFINLKGNNRTRSSLSFVTTVTFFCNLRIVI